VRIGDQKWLSANQKLVEEEIQQKLEVWRSFPGLENRTRKGA
jgi:CRISPR/Cas system CMR-associated protein Cmr1 (group 7 of RAMP superfamily)